MIGITLAFIVAAFASGDATGGTGGGGGGQIQPSNIFGLSRIVIVGVPAAVVGAVSAVLANRIR